MRLGEACRALAVMLRASSTVFVLPPGIIRVYTNRMSATAKVFKSGNSQAVRLPRQVRLAANVKELAVEREGERLVLSPVRPATFSAAFWRVLGDWPSYHRPTQVRQRRGRLFR